VLKTGFGSLLDSVCRIVGRTIFKATDASIDQGIDRWNSIVQDMWRPSERQTLGCRVSCLASARLLLAIFAQ
jgi:hypothetical protein